MANGSHEAQPTFGHTFHIVEKNAGFLGLGTCVQMIENDKILDEAIVYGDSFHAIKLHMDAEAAHVVHHALAERVSVELPAIVQQIDKDRILKTNAGLAKRFQRTHPSNPVTLNTAQPSH